MISVERVQTFIFDVPRLKAMLGANALIGQALRYELPKLLGDRGLSLAWPESDPTTRDRRTPWMPRRTPRIATIRPPFTAGASWPVTGATSLPLSLTARLPRTFYGLPRRSWLPCCPGCFLMPCWVRTSVRSPNRERFSPSIHPVLQVCTETGQEPASDTVPDDGGKRYQARSVTHRLEWGAKFHQGREPRDIISLMRVLTPPPRVLGAWGAAQLTAGDYLALIHADGNGIGLRYKACQQAWSKGQEKPAIKEKEFDVAREAQGEAFFHSTRLAVRRAIVDALDKTFPDSYAVCPYEVLMLGGDDLLLVCRADQALELARHYATELDKYSLADGKPLQVAIGVAIAQQSYPLHRLHELAEALAGSAKRSHRSLGDAEKASVIDWQVVTQSWFAGSPRPGARASASPTAWMGVPRPWF